MTTKLLAKFDGRVIIPNEPVTLPVGTSLRVTVEDNSPGASRIPAGVSGHDLNEWLSKQQIDRVAVAEMQKAIEEGCEKVDADGW